VKRLTTISLMIISLLLAGCFKNEEETAISLVQEGYLEFDNSVSIGSVLENNTHLSDQKWTYFTTEIGKKIVQFDATVNSFKNDIFAWEKEDKALSFIEEYQISEKLVLQFIITKDESFRVEYVGLSLEGSPTLLDILEGDKLQSLFTQGWPVNAERTYKKLYDNKPPQLASLQFNSIQKKIATLEINMVQEWIKSQAFEYEAAGLPKKKPIAIYVYRNDETGALLGCNFNNGWGEMFASSVNPETGATCSFFERYNINETGTFTLKNSNCNAEITYPDEKVTSISIVGMDGCDFCGMGATLDGEYKPYAKAKYCYLDSFSQGEIHMSVNSVFMQ